MNTTRTPLREIGAYLGIAYALALSVSLALPHANINKLLSMLVPMATVVILTFTITPRGSRRRLWREMGIGRLGFKAWPSALVVPFLLAGGAYGTAVVIGAGRLKPVDLGNAPDWAINVLLGLVIGTLYAINEEIGWRGYLLPRFQKLTSKRRAAVVTGFFHGCFHLPLILLATTYDSGSAKWFAAPMAVAVITAGGVFYAWIWDRAQTAWPVAVAHNAVNTIFDIGAASILTVSGWNMAYVAGETGFATLGVCVIAAVVLLRTARVWRSPKVEEPAQELVAVPAA